MTEWGFGKCQAHILAHCKCDHEENMHNLHVGNVVLFQGDVCLFFFLISTLYGHKFAKCISRADFQLLSESA